MQIAQTPKPPYYAVIFTSFRTEIDNGYDKTAQQILDTAYKQPGFLGFESARNKIGILLERFEINRCLAPSG